MEGIIIGAENFDILTIGIGLRYMFVYISPADFPYIKQEFGVGEPSHLLDKPIKIDFFREKIFSVPGKGATPEQESKGVKCSYCMPWPY